MILRRLEMAIAIDAHRSFNRAARALGVSQPALTRALQTLEDELGARLFERGKSECEPTVFGRVVLTRARRIVSELTETRREIDFLRDLKTGELKVGIGNAAPQQWVGSAIGDLCAANPKLRVTNVELAGYDHPKALMAGEIDVGVGEPPPDLESYPNIVVARLPRRPCAFFCRMGHPLTKLAQVEMKDIGAFPFTGPRLKRRAGVHFPSPSAMGAMSADGEYFEPTILCATWTAIREIVLRSDVVGVRVLALLKAPENRDDLFILPFRAPWLASENSIMWRRDRMPHPALKAFCDAVRRREATAMNEKPTIQVVA